MTEGKRERGGEGDRRESAAADRVLRRRDG